MNKSQWWVLGIAAGLFALLSVLPKVVVESDAVQALGEAPAEGAAPAHVSALDEAQRVALAVGKRAYRESSGDAKEVALDSLVALWVSFNRYDSAAAWVQSHAEAQNSQKHWEKAAELYYEAFTFALSEEKAKEMAGLAQGILERLVSADPKRLDLKVKLGMTQVATVAPMVGVQTIRQVLDEQPGFLPARLQLGLLSMRSGQHDKAVGHFEQVLSQEPKHEEALFYLGVAHAELEHHAEAEEAFRKLKSITSNPEILQTADRYLTELSQHQH